MDYVWSERIMRYSFAPMEGITGFVFRNVHAQCFPGTDRYFTPFLTVNQNRSFKTKEKKDISPDNNRNVRLIPQVIANKPGDFVWAVRYMEDLGYSEVNLNLGCPSPTVLRQHRGAAMLERPDDLDAFFDESFSLLGSDPVHISVKMRAGYSSFQEMEELVPIFNRYPFSEIILHPRTAKEAYSGKADREVYKNAAAAIHHPMTYNGDIQSGADLEDVLAKVPQTDSVMIGRGLLVNPALVRELQGGQKLEKAELKSYHDELLASYCEEFHQDRTVLFRMKELWSYMGRKINAGEQDERLKRNIKKADRIEEYRLAVEKLFEAGELCQD